MLCLLMEESYRMKSRLRDSTVYITISVIKNTVEELQYIHIKSYKDKR